MTHDDKTLAHRIDLLRYEIALLGRQINEYDLPRFGADNLVAWAGRLEKKAVELKKLLREYAALPKALNE